VFNKLTGQKIVLGKEDVALIQKLQGRKHPTVATDEQYQVRTCGGCRGFIVLIVVGKLHGILDRNCYKCLGSCPFKSIGNSIAILN